MKKINLLVLLTLTFITAITFNAYTQTKADPDKKITINAKGGIYDNGTGTKLGFIGKDNIVRSNKGEKLYFIDREGNVIDAAGKKLGKAQKNGNYYNIEGQNVLLTKDLDQEKCAILDPAGHNFGSAHKNYKLHACAAHCFFMEQAKLKAAKK